MIYAGYDELSIISLEEETDTVSFHAISEAILRRPSNVIYFELKKRLYGIVSMGDIARASESGDGQVAINRNMTFILHDGYMTARQIFLEKESINAIPVVNEDHQLVGAYLRWDDLLIKTMPRGGQ